MLNPLNCNARTKIHPSVSCQQAALKFNANVRVNQNGKMIPQLAALFVFCQTLAQADVPVAPTGAALGTVPPPKCGRDEIYYPGCMPTCPVFCNPRPVACPLYCLKGCGCKPGYKRVNGNCVSLVKFCAGEGGHQECLQRTCGDGTKPPISYVCTNSIPPTCKWTCPCPEDQRIPPS